MELLDRLGHASSKAEEGPREARDAARLGPDPERGAGRPPAAAAGVNVLVTGGSRGIGRAIALRFARDGAARVAIGYLRNDAAAEATAEELRAAGAEPVLVRGNVTSERVLEQVARARPARRARPQRGDGRRPPGARDRRQALGLDDERERAAPCSRSRAPPRRRCRPGSSIVAISSLGAQRVLENYVLVGTSKAALEALVRYLAVELAPRGIRVNAVSAGVVETGALEHFPNREEMLDGGRARTRPAASSSPTTSPARSRSSARPDAEMVRGHVLVVDGGFSLVA